MKVNDQRRAMSGELIEKALKDPKFREELNSDPKGTLEKTWGVTLPDDLNVHIHNESNTDLHFVLPHAGTESLELPEMHPEHSSWHHVGHVTGCVVECTQCSNNETSCQPGPTGE
jgi:hypothetical protein